MKITGIINGVDVYVNIARDKTILDLVVLVCTESNNTGRSFDEWHIHNQRGQQLDGSMIISDSGIEDGSRIFFNLGVGAGGDKTTISFEARVAEIADELQCFIEAVTLHLQKTNTPEQDRVMFQRAYRLYNKHDVETAQALTKKITALAEERDKERIKEAYISGYESGHNDTVESSYGDSAEKADEYLEENMV